MTTIEKIKELRLEADGLSQLVKELQYYPNSMSWEIRNSHTNICLAKAWLGKILGHLGDTCPYINEGSRRNVSDIEPTAEVSNKTTSLSKLNYIEKIDAIRDLLSDFTEKSQDFDFNYFDQILQKDIKIDSSDHERLRYLSIAKTKVYECLTEAKFWMGFELQRIRNSNG